jgi:ribosomal protein S18 acetylase RimI-like enzyme
VIPTSVQIREFRFPEDYDPVHRLWQGIEKGVRVGRSDTPGEIEKKLSRDPDLFLVAEFNDEIVGSVIGGFDGRRGMVYHLAVAATYRGQGIGTRLMDEIESRLRAKGCLKCYLLVATNNYEVEGYYKQLGWQPMTDVHLFGKTLS